MQRPSYPKETADQWPPIAGDHTGWGRACNQSINTGRSLGEQYNLMRHTPTHTSPLIWFPPPPPQRPSPSTRNLFFFSYSVYFCRAPITTKQSCASPLLYFPLSSLNHPNSKGTGRTKGRNAVTLEKVERTAVEAVREIDGFWWVSGVNYLPKSSGFDNCLT